MAEGIYSEWVGGSEWHTSDPVAAQVHWDAAIAAARRAHADNPGHEACGYIVARPFPLLVEAHNKSQVPGRFEYAFPAVAQIYEALDKGMLLGLWHSHPHGHREPSDLDWTHHPRGVPLYIVSIESDNEALVLRYDDDDREHQRSMAWVSDSDDDR